MSKKNVFLGCTLAVLVAFSYIWSGPFQDWKASSEQVKNFLAGISAGQVTKIEVARAGVQTVLEKDGEVWRVNGAKDFYVKKDVANALGTLLSEAGMKQLEVASTAKSKKSSFGTGDEGMIVKIIEGEKSLELIVGKSTADLSGTYISTATDDKTYVIGLDLNSFFGREEWRDPTIFSFIKERVNKVRFQYGKTNFVLDLKEGKWVPAVKGKYVISTEKMTALLAVMENLTAAKIPAQDFKGTGLEKNGQIIQVTGESLDETLMVGDCTKDNLCYAKRGDSDNIYLITKAQKDALNKKLADLK